MSTEKSSPDIFFEHIAEQVEAYLQQHGQTKFFAMFLGDASLPENGTMYWSNADRFTRESISDELHKAVTHMTENRCHGRESEGTVRSSGARTRH